MPLHRRWLISALALVWAILASLGPVHTTRLTTYYPTGNPTASGEWPYAGSAACSYNYPLGARATFWDGYTIICNDRGDLGWSPWWDVYTPTRADAAYVLARYGEWAEVRVTLPDEEE